MSRHGNDHVYSYFPTFFSWVRCQFFMLDDYAYAGTNFRNDFDFYFLHGLHWDANLHKKQEYFYVFKVL